jgi:hypothetical protein
MPELLVIDVALCAVLIMVAALIVIGHRRRSRGRSSTRAEERHEPSAGPAAPPMAERHTAMVPGLSTNGGRPDLGARAEPEPAAQPHVSAKAAAEPRASAKAAAESRASAEPAAESQVSAVTGPKPSANGHGPEPNANGHGPPPGGQRAAADTVATGDPIGSYYDEADRPMSDYLAALGWTEDRRTGHPSAAETDVASAPDERASKP